MELRIPFDQIRSSQSITPIVRRLLAEKFGDANAIHRYDVVKLEDDEDLRIRVLTLKPKTYVVMG
jgi:hypothetical protein